MRKYKTIKFDVVGKRPAKMHILDRLQSAFSLKIRLVLISSSSIANHDVIITIRDPRFSRLAARGFAARVLRFRVQQLCKEK